MRRWCAGCWWSTEWWCWLTCRRCIYISISTAIQFNYFMYFFKNWIHICFDLFILRWAHYTYVYISVRVIVLFRWRSFHFHSSNIYWIDANRILYLLLNVVYFLVIVFLWLSVIMYGNHYWPVVDGSTTIQPKHNDDVIKNTTCIQWKRQRLLQS